MWGDFYKGFEEKPAVMLWTVSKLWQHKRAEALRKLGVTQAQFITIGWLFWFKRQKKDVTQVMLAKKTKIDIMHMSRIVRALEKKGVLTRTQSPTDSRANYIRITRKGELIAPKAVHDVSKAQEKFFAPIKSNEKEFVALMKTLIEANDISQKEG